MKFGLVFANAGPSANPEHAAGLARLAEENGFESLWTVEHVVVPAAYESQYPYSPTGKMPGNEDNPIPDPLIWLTWVAAATRTLKLATGILILPQRNPVILAKECATIDVLSGGRLTLGVGIGWLAEEFEAIGVPFDGAVVAGEIGSYKPAHGHWEAFYQRFGAERSRHVHVAASLFHDIAPAQELGLTAVWINRLGETSDLSRAAELADLAPLPETLELLVPPDAASG